MEDDTFFLEFVFSDIIIFVVAAAVVIIFIAAFVFVAVEVAIFTHRMTVCANE